MNFCKIFFAAVAVVILGAAPRTAVARGNFEKQVWGQNSFLAQLLQMKFARVGHSMVALPNKHILVAGGAYSGLGTTQDVEFFIPGRRTFVKAKVMLAEPRMGATLTLLQSGDALVAGGANDFEMALESAEIIGKEGNSQFGVANMTAARSGHTATLLPSGKVLIVGGFDGSAVLDSAELFDPETRTFLPLSSHLAVPRSGHTATLVNNRFVLIAGGESNGNSVGPKGDWAPLASAEVFDVREETFEPTKNLMSSARLFHQATVIDENAVLLSGGISGVAKGNANADIFVTNTLKFEPVQPMRHERSMHTATRLSNGNVLLCGGVEKREGTASCEVFVAKKAFFQSAQSLAVPRWGHAALELPSGGFLFSGGMSQVSFPLSQQGWGPSKLAEIYRP